MGDATAVILISLGVGICSVLQSTLNKTLMLTWGLELTVFLTCALMALISGVYLFVSQKFSNTQVASLEPHFLFSKLGVWITLAAILGALILYGYPYAMKNFGATRVIVLAVTAQCLTGLVWDYFAEGQSPSSMRLIGTLLAVVGATLAQAR